MVYGKEFFAQLFGCFVISSTDTSMCVTFTILILALSLGTSTAEEKRKNSSSDDERRKSRSENHSAKFFKNLDFDEDGKVTREEFGKANRLEELDEKVKNQLFERLDKNSDGILTPNEIRSKGSKKPPENFGNLLKQADKDSDQKITFEEFSAHPRFSKLKEIHQKHLFERMDRNENGVIDPKDHPERNSSLKVLKDFDEDENGSLSLAEFLKTPHLERMPENMREKNFSRFDQDQNGEISIEELKKLGRSLVRSQRDKDKEPRKPRREKPNKPEQK